MDAAPLCGAYGCSPDNGTGVYYAEDGFAGIGSLKLMITHFVNHNGSAVTFQGRYLHPTTQQWTVLTDGVVKGARYTNAKYKQTYWAVIAVGETVKGMATVPTLPTWTLRDPMYPAAAAISVTNDQLQFMALDLELSIPGVSPEGPATKLRYSLEFDQQEHDQLSLQKPVVYSYNLRWGESGQSPAPNYYCFKPKTPGQLADGLEKDPVVFQQGIGADPLTGKIDHKSSPSLVTMSCRGGAPATVYSWGYPYWGNETFYFDAGIHMKRASYCADSSYYTRAGTIIQIDDNQNLNRTIDNTKLANDLEAWWTPEGATCLGKQRHPEISFSGYCPAKGPPAPGNVPDTKLGSCDAVPPEVAPGVSSPVYLINAPK